MPYSAANYTLLRCYLYSIQILLTLQSDTTHTLFGYYTHFIWILLTLYSDTTHTLSNSTHTLFGYYSHSIQILLTLYSDTTLTCHLLVTPLSAPFCMTPWIPQANKSHPRISHCYLQSNGYMQVLEVTPWMTLP